MDDGLYKVEFHTPMGFGAGVVFLQGGRLHGGDAGLFYVGTFAQHGNEFIAEVVTDRHTQYPGIVSVFGKDRVHIALKGQSNGNSGLMQGTAVEAPGLKFTAKLSRIAD
ncbi:GrlR family regulatory protein [Bradyrhizobium sp. S69]|uniref:GrlR family regulatory protein n=1 Tax=Bradyrhizobium sp. S69 TaxID=1641856 RepID=UPI00131CDC16|nr:GrlR family regulatory protein [Bradyrhizobium sp. S69]